MSNITINNKAGVDSPAMPAGSTDPQHNNRESFKQLCIAFELGGAFGGLSVLSRSEYIMSGAASAREYDAQLKSAPLPSRSRR